MQVVIPAIAIVILATTAIISTFWVLRQNNKKRESFGTKSPAKRRKFIIREVNRRLEANPKDPIALESIARFHYQEGNFAKAMRAYQTLVDYASDDPRLDEAELNLRYGLSAIQSNFLPEAQTALMAAQIKKPNDFEIRAGLGKLEFAKKEYSKAIRHLQETLRLNPRHGESAKLLGLALFQLEEYAKSIKYLKFASDAAPGDTETLFTLARSLYEASSYSAAHSIFNRLKNNPKWGLSSYLYSGLIHEKSRNWNDSISDYQAIINYRDAPSEIALEAKYRLAEIFSQTHQFGRAFTLLSEISKIAPEYRDIANRMKQHYQEANGSLKTYLSASPDRFIILCKKLVRMAYTGAKVTIIEVDSKQKQCVDLIASVRIAHRDSLIIFRYMRTDDEVGVSYLQSLYSRSQERHASRSLCFAPGTYSQAAEHFAKTRPIKLIDKQKLTEYLETINSEFISKQS